MKELQTSWKHPASTRAVSCAVEVLYPLDEADKLGLKWFPPVGQKLVALAFSSGLAMTEDPACPNKQSRVTETLLRKNYAAAAASVHMLNYMTVFSGYMSQILGSLPEQTTLSFDAQTCLKLSDQILRLCRYQGQTLGRVLSSAVAIRRHLWLSEAHFQDKDKATILDALVTAGHTFGPAVDEMLRSTTKAKEANQMLYDKENCQHQA
ncbi:UNVERIFIED_CONTAM: hypothetical protein FKN15_009245 [Acipenser sinensis]